jgi:hypothetical protein
MEDVQSIVHCIGEKLFNYLGTGSLFPSMIRRVAAADQLVLDAITSSQYRAAITEAKKLHQEMVELAIRKEIQDNVEDHVASLLSEIEGRLTAEGCNHEKPPVSQ